MKAIPATLLLLALAPQLVSAQSQASKGPGAPPASTATGVAGVRAKLEQIRIPEIAYDGLTLDEVVNDLRGYAKRNDPDRKGVNFLIKPDARVAMEQVLVNVKFPMFDLTLKEVLDVLVRTADVDIKYVVEDYGIVFQPDNDPHAPIAAPAQADPSSKAAKIRAQMKQIRFPVIAYDGLTLDEVLSDVIEQTRRQHAGINFVLAAPHIRFAAQPPAAAQKWPPGSAPVLDAMGNPISAPPPLPRRPAPGVDLSQVLINIRLPLSDVTLEDTLNAMVATADAPLRYTVEDYGVAIELVTPNNRPLVTEIIKVDPQIIRNGLRALAGKDTFGDPKAPDRPPPRLSLRRRNRIDGGKQPAPSGLFQSRERLPRDSRRSGRNNPRQRDHPPLGERTVGTGPLVQKRKRAT